MPGATAFQDSGKADPTHHFAANPPLIPFHSLPFLFLPSPFLIALPSVQELTAKSSTDVWGMGSAMKFLSGVRVQLRPQKHFSIFRGKEVWLYGSNHFGYSVGTKMSI